MRDIASTLVKVGLMIGVMLLIRTGFRMYKPKEPPRTIQFAQTWQLQPGDVVAGRPVIGGLGDIAIDMGGKSLRAPFDGLVQPYKGDCVVYTTGEIPAYLFRLCGIQNPRLGDIRAGDAIGSANDLRFATLRKQPNGTWSFVEPSKDVLERTLKQP